MVPVAPDFLSMMLDISFAPKQRGFTVKLHFSENGIDKAIEGEAECMRERIF